MRSVIINGDIADLKAFASATKGEIFDIHDEIKDIRLTIEGLSAKAPGANFGAFPDESINVNGISTENKDLLIIALLILNILMIIGGCICCSFWRRSQVKSEQYGGVRDSEPNDEHQK